MRSIKETAVALIRRHTLLMPGHRVAAAVSGGLDSVALLRLLVELKSELGIVVSVAHFNHQLRGVESDADERFVADLADKHDLVFHGGAGDVQEYSNQHHLSVEAGARALRYQFLSRLVTENVVDRVATAHTLDDQAETVLLRLVRGAGTRGLAGIYPTLSSTGKSAENTTTIIRPLLGVQRKELQGYLNEIDQTWREDSSNRDLRHSRNRLRHGIMPRLARDLNPSVQSTLAETAEIAREEEAHWNSEVKQILPRVWNQEDASLSLQELRQLSIAMQRRVIRGAASSIGLTLEFRHVEEVLLVASGESGGAALPKDWVASAQAGRLRFDPVNACVAADFEYPLPVPGCVDVPELNASFEALLVHGSAEGYNPQDYKSEELGTAGVSSAGRPIQTSNLLVRNWRPGDRFWAAHAKSEKKVKELLQERRITGTERKQWPVVVYEDRLIWMRGFTAKHPVKLEASEHLLIREIPFGSRSSKA
jgi:tRNA(Ile)-lysidine synthase